MVLWIVMAALAAAACLPLLAPLYRGGGARPLANASAMAIYRDQLGELDRDVARGVVAPGEAGAARTEIARRLIRESEARPAASAAPTDGLRKFATVAIIAMPIAALALYLAIGSPYRPDEPLASRAEVGGQQEITNLISSVETHLAAVPDDGKGWEVIAPVYLRLGRTADAVRAFTNAMRILGATPAREANLGEALVQAAAGTVTADARTAFQRANATPSDDPRPRFYLALALQQETKKDEAIAAWHALLQGAPVDQPWVAVAKSQLAMLEDAGPSAADVDAAANMPAADRAAMIEGMVVSLAAKLKADPSDADGWARLMRSYVVLNRAADARAALVEARAAFVNDVDKGAIIEAAAKDLGLTETVQ